MKRIGFVGAIAAAFVAGLIGFAVKGNTVTLTAEAQDWWRAAGIVIPSEVEQHVHLQVTVPADGTPVDGTIDVPVVIKLHNATGAATSVRVSNSGTVMQTWPIALGPCADCTWTGTVKVDFAKWTTGRDEMRWTANIPRNGDGLRQYQSTGYQVCVRACLPSYRPGPWIEARGWYTGHGYANARLTSPLATVCSSCIITISLKPGDQGLPTKQAGVYIDPDFHNGSAGTIVREWSGPFTGSLMLPSLTPGPHRLVLLSSDGLNAGVLAIPFEVPA